MSWFRRRPKLPASLRPALGPEERVLAWAPVSSSEGALVATNHGLWLPDDSSRPAAENPGVKTKKLGWHEIHKAAWSGRELRITPAEVAEERPGYAGSGRKSGGLGAISGPPNWFIWSIKRRSRE